MIRFLFLTIVLLSISNTVLAAGSEFNIKVLSGDDTTPPTTPTLLSAVPTAYSQIDVAWSASTDNFTFGGYVLLRDGTPIATTTQTSFNDTGLTPETLYNYEVYAFDNFLNISTTSNSIATTTPALPVVTPPVTATTTEDETTSESTKVNSLRYLNIITTNHEANFTWETFGSSRYTLRWGKNNEYNGGYISNDTYRSQHKTVISDLEADTQYFYELVGHTPSGISRILKTGEFKTKPNINNFPIPNVLRLSALVDKDDVILSWQLPATVEIKSIRVVGNPNSYPTDINDGEVIYDGLGTKALDTEAFKEGSSKHYSVFVIDTKGNISSGAVVLVNKESTNELIPGKQNSKPVGTSTSESENIITEEMTLHDFSINNIKIFQHDLIYDFSFERINLFYQEPFTISIPYTAVPRHLKSIVVTLLDPTDNRRSYSFLLRINKDGSAYESTIAPLNVLGSSRLQVEIFDFESELIGLYRKQINFKVKSLETDNLNNDVVFPDKIIETIKNSTPFIFSLIGILLLIALFIWHRKRTEDN